MIRASVQTAGRYTASNSCFSRLIDLWCDVVASTIIETECTVRERGKGLTLSAQSLLYHSVPEAVQKYRRK